MSRASNPTPFSVTITTDRDRTLLRLKGELDFATVGELAPVVARLLQDAPTAVVIEARQLEFADLVGMRPLLDLADILPPGAVRVRGARRPVVRVLQALDRADLLD